jgi:hypothetical protein
MKKLISTIAIAYCYILIAGCDNTQNNSSMQTQQDTVTQVKTDSSKTNSVNTTATANQSKIDNTKQASSRQPTVGTVKSMQNGDLLCYVILVDENGTEHNVGADFDICAQEKAFLNKKVRVYYETVSVSDCQSAEPCGKTRKESIATKMEILGKKS